MARPRRRLLHRFFTRPAAGSASTSPTASRKATDRTPRRCSSCATKAASVVVTVDCGTTAHAPLAAAAKAGLDVVVIDHHAAEPKLPRGLRGGEPNRLDEASRSASWPPSASPSCWPSRSIARCAQRGWFEDRAGARPARAARSRRSGHGLRRRPADRPQPRARRTGAEGDRAAAQDRPGGARRSRARRAALRHLPSRFHPRSAHQRRRPHRRGRSRRAPAHHGRSARGARARRAPRRAQPRTPGDRGGRARGGPCAASPPKAMQAPLALGRRRRLASGRDRHRRGAAEASTTSARPASSRSTAMSARAPGARPTASISAPR